MQTYARCLPSKPRLFLRSGVVILVYISIQRNTWTRITTSSYRYKSFYEARSNNNTGMKSRQRCFAFDIASTTGDPSWAEQETREFALTGARQFYSLESGSVRNIFLLPVKIFRPSNMTVFGKNWFTFWPKPWRGKWQIGKYRAMPPYNSLHSNRCQKVSSFRIQTHDIDWLAPPKTTAISTTTVV